MNFLIHISLIVVIDVPGDNVSIFVGGTGCRTENHCIDGVLFDVSETDITVTIDKLYDFSETESHSIKHFPSLSNIKRILKAICDMEASFWHHLCNVLMGDVPAKDPLPSPPPMLCSGPISNKVKMFNGKCQLYQ